MSISYPIPIPATAAKRPPHQRDAPGVPILRRRLATLLATHSQIRWRTRAERRLEVRHNLAWHHTTRACHPLTGHRGPAHAGGHGDMSRWQVYGPRIFDTVAFSRALFSYIPKYDFYIPNATIFSKATELLMKPGETMPSSTAPPRRRAACGGKCRPTGPFVPMLAARSYHAWRPP